MTLAKMFAIHYGVWFFLLILAAKEMKGWKGVGEFCLVVLIFAIPSFAIHWGVNMTLDYEIALELTRSKIGEIKHGLECIHIGPWISKGKHDELEAVFKDDAGLLWMIRDTRIPSGVGGHYYGIADMNEFEDVELVMCKEVPSTKYVEVR